MPDATATKIFFNVKPPPFVKRITHSHIHIAASSINPDIFPNDILSEFNYRSAKLMIILENSEKATKFMIGVGFRIEESSWE